MGIVVTARDGSTMVLDKGNYRYFKSMLGSSIPNMISSAKVNAIKEFRTKYNLSLKEAKDFVEVINAMTEVE